MTRKTILGAGDRTAFRTAADYLDRLAEDTDYQARCERKDGNHGMAKTERNYASGYRESARALREAATGGES